MLKQTVITSLVERERGGSPPPQTEQGTFYTEKSRIYSSRSKGVDFSLGNFLCSGKRRERESNGCVRVACLLALHPNYGRKGCPCLGMGSYQHNIPVESVRQYYGQ